MQPTLNDLVTEATRLTMQVAREMGLDGPDGATLRAAIFQSILRLLTTPKEDTNA